ncbi:VRR-NUC domain-containing protein [Paraburkholderia unamae]|uniref:phosphodiesterase I n=1 Tax=Paraburkholderia unamae TaxID=219649 RepID=A0ABX5KAK0_9BURK|nr:VRR-NUC domain-containing protein [Paraburkholderia unamae]PVX71990.1 VRR-NUC domain-containing protein [Paraburkholderia unamae]
MLPDSPDPFYYLANFERALAWLDARCADLFGEAERRFVDDFARLPQPARALFVRMLMRLGPHFRASRLQYDEIGCPRAAAAPLVAAGWLDGAPTLELGALAPLVTKAELQALASSLGITFEARATRAATLETLHAAAPEPRAWHAWFPASPDTVLLFAAAPLCERLRLMFFGNLHQDWTEFVLADLGVYRYESVPLDDASRAFQRRDDIDAYLALRDCREALDSALRDAASNAAAPADADAAIATTLATLDGLAARTHANPWLRARHDKLRHAVGLAAERVGAAELAWRAYLDCGHPESRYRRVRVLEQLARRDEALALAQAIAAAPANEEEAQRATRTLGRLARTRARSKATPSAAAAPAFAQRELTLPRAPMGLRVEEAARLALATTDAPVFYVENTLINALFGLLCWPALFAPLPGAFFHPFQRGPADLHAADFVTRRATQFEACLGELDTQAYRESIVRRYAEKAGIQSPFVAWPALSDDLLALALDCFPAAHLRLWFERLLREPVANRSGLPDLVRFWPQERRYELIEVKGPGDRLQDNQRRWLAYCATHDMPVSVLQVRWPGESAESDESDESDQSDKTDESGGASATAQASNTP